ncbi:MAG: DUF3147 family protein [Planctomycetes bacterium]|nr:DUF3147 family protein [Planctomycetota bacterium]
MQYFIKIIVSVSVILTCTSIGKKLPSLAGLLAVMPLTGLLVMLFVYFESENRQATMLEYNKGALWGIIPSIMFFAVAFWAFKRQFSLPTVLVFSFSAWIFGAAVHQYFLK